MNFRESIKRTIYLNIDSPETVTEEIIKIIEKRLGEVLK